MNLRVLCGAGVLFALIAAVCLVPRAGSARIRPARHVQPTPDADYVAALAAANKFLYAWQTHDEEAGLLLLSNALKKSSSEANIANFFGSTSQATYEIGRGKRLKPGLYAFPLALYRSESGKDQLCRPHYAELDVIKTGKEDWVIDKLP